MQYIQNLSEYIERLAHTSIYDLNNANKALAEQEFTNFVFQLPVDQYEQLLESSSEHVVLAFAAVLLKNIAAIEQHILEIMPRVNDILMRWYQPNGTLRRGQGDQLKLYVENTYGQFMGNCLRVIFQRAGGHWKEMINGFLDNLGGKPHYRLFLYYRFIESFSNTVESIPYVEYRTHLSTFQDTYIPRIFEALSPYFVNISDAMDVSELSFLQSSLSLVAAEESPLCVLEFSVKNRFTELVFQLLEQVTAFRFNISNREYEDMEEFENIQISFPEELLVKVMKQSFLEALYSILMQLMRTNEFKYQETCLNCLKKILLAKITYISRDMQTRFIFNNMEGVLNLLRLIVNNKVTHRLNALHILQCTYNFVKTFGFDEINKKIAQDQRYGVLFRDFLEVTRAVPLFLLQYDTEPLNSENQLFLAAAQLSAEIGNELKINRVEYDINIYVEHYRTFTSAFLNTFICNAKDILAGKPFTFEELKRASKDLLGNVKVLTTYNYVETFTMINNCCDFLFKLETNEIGAGNAILLIEEMIRESCFLQESIFGRGIVNGRQGEMEQTSGELDGLAEILTKTLNFILAYQSQTANPYAYLNNAMVVFLSTLLERCSRRLSVGSEEFISAPFIDDELYRRIKQWMRGDDDEQFLLNCLFALGKFIRCAGMSNIDFIFQQLHDAITVIKSNMKREYFKKTAIYQEMLSLFKTLSLEPMPLEFMKWRVLLFKIITALSFDDALDEYRGSIRNTVELIRNSAMQGQWVKVLYDLTGIFESIDGRIIFRYFVRTFAKVINMEALMKELFTLGFDKPKAYLRDVMHLSWYLVENHNNRIDVSDEAKNIYEALTIIIPFWNKFLQNEGNFDAEDTLVQVYTAFSSIINGKHINICLLDVIIPVEFRQFIKLTICTMCKNLQTIESSSEIAQSLFSLGLQLAGTVAKPLFNLDDLDVGKGIHYFVNEVMKKLISSFETLASGMMEENLLEPMLKIIERYFDFVRVHHDRLHLPNLNANISYVIGDVEGKALFLEVVIKIAMEFRNHFASTTQLIANICVILIKFYQIDSTAIGGRLGLNDPKDIQELDRIFKHVREDLEDYDWLTLQMKDWLKVRIRFVSFAGNDY